jgi:pimeloyl-ACP methyl ester carboxylesterase/DNA-binding CsgD family transcriptional regulator
MVAPSGSPRSGARGSCCISASAATQPIPPPGPLSQPRSQLQVGVPVQPTRDAVPPDNPQTPEKIARPLTRPPCATSTRIAPAAPTLYPSGVPAFHQDIRFTHSADGTRLAYAVNGHGFPLVRAAHWLTNIDRDWRTPVWRPWFDAFGARYRFHRYDSRGCGLSDRASSDASLDVLVKDLEAVVDAAKLDRFALLGISQGGAVSMAYAASHPERVSHLVLLGAFARGPLRRNPTPEELESHHAQIKLIETGWGQDNPAFRQLFTNLIFPNASPEQIRSFNDLQRMSCTPHHAARLVSRFSDIDASSYLPRVACPTLVLHTRGDMCAPFDEGLFVASSIAGARLVPLETKSHVPTPGEPSFERVIEEIEAFVGAAREGKSAFPDLTRRERQVLEHIARGLDNAQIAAHLDLSEKTVRNHITGIFEKIGVENRAQAIVQAREAGLAEPRR